MLINDSTSHSLKFNLNPPEKNAIELKPKPGRGKLSEMIAYWTSLGKNGFLELGDAISQQFLEVLSNLEKFTSDNKEEINRKFITKKVDEDGYFMWPIQTHNGKNIVICKFFKSEELLFCRVMDRSLSPEHEYSATRAKHLYCLPDVNLGGLYDENNAFIDSLIQRLRTIDNDRENSYSKNDVKTLLMTAARETEPASTSGKLISGWKEGRDEWEDACRLILRDLLVEAHWSEQEIDRVFWLYRKAGIQADNASEKALRDFLAHTEKVFANAAITRQEYANEVLCIEKKLRQPCTESISKPSLRIGEDASLVIKNEGRWFAMPPPKFEVKPAPPMIVTPRPEIPTFDPKALSPFLKEAAKFVEHLFESMNLHSEHYSPSIRYMSVFTYVKEIFHAFPPIEDSSWDRVPEQDRVSALQHLKTLTSYSLDSILLHCDRQSKPNQKLDSTAQASLLIYHAWAICIRLLRDHDELFLQDHHFVNLLTRNSPLCVTLEEVQLFRNISQYFETLKKLSGNEKALFDFTALPERKNALKDESCWYDTYLIFRGNPEKEFTLAYLKMRAKDESFFPFLKGCLTNNNNPSALALLFYFGYLANLKIHTEYGVNTLQFDLATTDDQSILFRASKDITLEYRALQQHSIAKPYARTRVELKISNADENTQVLHEKPASFELPSKIYHALLQIRAEPSLQLENAMAFCHFYITYLHLVQVQSFLELCFLERSAIIQAFAAKVEQRDQRLRDLADRLLFYFPLNRENFSSALFWLRMAYCFETHYAQPYDCARIKSFYDRIVAFKDQLKGQELCSASFFEATLVQIYLFSHLSPENISDQQLFQLAKLWMLIVIPSQLNIPLQAKWLKIEAQYIIDRHQERLLKFLSLESGGQEILNSLSISTDTNDEWQGAFPNYNKGPYSINLLDGRVVFKDEQVLTYDWPKYELELNGEISSLLPDPLPPIYLRKRYLGGQIEGYAYRGTTLDGKWEFYYEPARTRGSSQPSKLELWQRIETRQGTTMFQYVPLKDRTHLPKSLREKCKVWLQRDRFEQSPPQDKRPPRRVPRLELIYDAEGTAIAGSYLEESGGYKLNRIENGELQKEVLVDFQKLSEEQKTYIKRLVLDVDAVRLWVDSDSNLSHMDYLDISFRFIHENGVWRAHCTLFPNNYLAEEQPTSPQFPNGAIYLVNSRGMPQVLLPSIHFRHGRFICPSAPKRDRYFLYDYDPTQTILRPQSTAAALYLVYVNLSKGFFAEALTYLDRTNPTKPFDTQEWDILREIVYAAPSDFMSHCVNIHLAKLVIEVSTFFDKSKEASPETMRQRKAFWNNFSERLMEYYNHNSEQNQKWPSSRRIDEQDHQKILATIKENNAFGESDSKKNKTLGLVLRRLTLNDKVEEPVGPSLTVITTEDADNLSVQKNVWKPENQLQVPRNFIRFKDPIALFVFTYFCDLYDRARKATRELADIDLDLHCLRSIATHDNSVKLLKILFAVRKSPKHFPLECKNLSDFKEVCKVACTIPAIAPPPAPKIDPYRPNAGTVVRPTYHRPRAVEHKPGGWPAKDIFLECFRSEKKQFDQGPFVLSKVEFSDPLANKLIKDLKQTYKQNVNLIVYSEIPGKSYKDSLNKHINDLRVEIAKTKSLIDKLMAFGTDKVDYTIKEIQRLSKRLQKQKKALDLYDFLPFFCNSDLTGMQQVNPSLTTDQVNELNRCIRIYLEQITHLNLLQEANVCHTAEGAAAVLNQQRFYDPEVFPELLVYEFATGKFLRPQQAKLLQWILDSLGGDARQIMFEFEAGGGKTQVVAVIVAFRMIQQGKMPFFFSLSELQTINLEDLKHPFMQAYLSKTSTLSLDLHDKLNQSSLNKLEADLSLWLKQGRICVTSPETFHSLKLQYYSALDNGEFAAVEKLHTILSFFKEKAVFMIDEVHRNADALWQFIIATGTPASLEQHERQLFVHLYNALFGYLEKPLVLKDGRQLHTVLDLRANSQAKVTPADMDEIYAALRLHLLSYQPLDIAQNEYSEILAYWENKDIREPSCVSNHNGSEEALRRQQLISLTRGLLQQILPTVLSMVRVMDYDAADDDTASPCTMAQVSKAKYEVPEMAAALTTQLLGQIGLTTDQIKKLVQELLRQHNIDCKEDYSKKTDASNKFIEWQDQAETKLELGQLASINDSQLILLKKSLGQHPKAIEWYLTSIAFSQIEIFPEKLSSSYADLMDGAYQTISFSATLGLPEQYLYQPNSLPIQTGVKFHAAVIQRACHRRNETLLWGNHPNLTSLLNSVWNKYGAAGRVDGLIDVGGWFADDEKGESLAREFLIFAINNNLGHKGVVYINGNNRVCLLHQEGEEFKVKEFEGSNIKKALEECGMQNVRLFKIYDARHTTGMDLAIGPKEELMVTIGEGITHWNQIQGIMRMRGFLKLLEDLNDGQGIIWIGHEKLKDKIAKVTKVNQKKLTPVEVMTFGVHQQALRQSEILRIRAYLGIRHIVQNRIEHLMNQAKNATERCQIFQEHRGAFVETVFRNAVEAFGLPLTMEETLSTLGRYKGEIYLDAKLEPDNEDSVLIDGLIAQVATLIPQFPSQKKNALGGKMTQQSRNVGVQLQQSNRVVRAGVPAKAALEEDFAWRCSLSAPDFVNLLKRSASSANTIFGTDLLNPNIYYSPNAAKVAEGQEVIKPSPWSLIIREGKEKMVVLLSLADADAYQRQMGQLGQHLIPQQRTVYLMNSIGQVICFHGKDDNFLESSDFFDWRVQLQAIQGQLGNQKERQRLMEMMKGWPKAEVDLLWEQIQRKSVDHIPDPEIAAMELLIKEAYEERKKQTVQIRLPVPGPIPFANPISFAKPVPGPIRSPQNPAQANFSKLKTVYKVLFVVAISVIGVIWLTRKQSIRSSSLLRSL